jgi:hypothetical protein
MTDNAEQNNKPLGIRNVPFDPTVCFTVFGNWIEAMNDIEDASDLTCKPYMFMKAIADYSMFNEEPDFEMAANRWFKPFWPTIAQQINSSVENRQKGFKQTAVTKKEAKVIDAFRRNPEASVREIAGITGVNKSSVDRIRRKYAKRISDPAAAADAEGNADALTPDRGEEAVPPVRSLSGLNPASATSHDTRSLRGNSTGTGHTGTAGQPAAPGCAPDAGRIDRTPKPIHKPCSPWAAPGRANDIARLASEPDILQQLQAEDETEKNLW